MNAHLNELSERHRILERKIQEEMARPHVDNLKLTELKRKKLRLKEKIVHLEKVVEH